MGKDAEELGKRLAWMCPNHAEHALKLTDPLTGEARLPGMDMYRSQHRHRKVKKPTVVPLNTEREAATADRERPRRGEAAVEPSQAVRDQVVESSSSQEDMAASAEPLLSRKTRTRYGPVIEVETDSDSDSGFEEESDAEDGVVYKLPRKGIQLDFIAKVKA